SRRIDEGVVFGDTAIWIQPYELTLQLVQVLSRWALVVLAKRNEQVPVFIQCKAATKMLPHRQFRFLPENYPKILQSLEVGRQYTHADGCPRCTAISLLCIGQEDLAILMKVG